MPNLITSTLNEIITVGLSSGDVSTFGQGKLLAVQVSRQDPGFRITRIEFGAVCATQADEALLDVSGHLFLDLPPLKDNTTISEILGVATGKPFAPGSFGHPDIRRPYFRYRSRTQPFEFSDEFVEPIKIPAGSSFAMIVALWTQTALANAVFEYVCVRGEQEPYTQPIQEVKL